jgi:hypothetical protein
MPTTWRKEIKKAGGKKLLACTLSEEGMDVESDNGFGVSEGKPFTAWDKTYVYFPVCYDGAEWAGRVPRDPCDIATTHQGGQ